MTKHTLENRTNAADSMLEMTNFIDAVTSYSDFVTNAAILESGEFDSTDLFESFGSGRKCLIQSRSEIGLNIFYHVFITRPRGAEFQISIPWQAQEVCTHCQGQGQVYSWNSDNSAYEAVDCEECGGRGNYQEDSEINIFVNDTLCEQPIIRKRKAGRFNPRLGQRGDLIINITWVDELPPFGKTIN
jgi:Zn ribbon nucleic-acid-binding protein